MTCTKRWTDSTAGNEAWTGISKGAETWSDVGAGSEIWFSYVLSTEACVTITDEFGNPLFLEVANG